MSFDLTREYLRPRAIQTFYEADRTKAQLRFEFSFMEDQNEY